MPLPALSLAAPATTHAYSSAAVDNAAWLMSLGAHPESLSGKPIKAYGTSVAGGATGQADGTQGFTMPASSPGTLFGLPYWQVGAGAVAIALVAYFAMKK